MVDFTLSIPVPESVKTLLGAIPGLSTYTEWWLHLNPLHLVIETVLILVILYIVLWKRPSKKQTKLETLPPKVIEELIRDFVPEPLCPPVTVREESILEDYVILESKPSTETKIRGESKLMLNLTSFDFLGLSTRPEIEKAANDALSKYGCGSCGPRGFYGSIDVHVYLEQDLAKFYGTEEAIVYSDAASTVTSAIAAFCNRSDLLIVDEGCSDPIMTGVVLSRSRVLFFKHNDMVDLEKQLVLIDDEDKRLKRKPQRRFVVVEGLYRNFGDIVPLDQVVELSKKYKWRLFMDESHSIGSFGSTGKGVTEHFGVAVSDIDILCSALSTSLCSVGGFCVGTREVVDHQRLFGAGYCYSASSPPFVSTVASAALKLLENQGTQLARHLKNNSQLLHKKLQGSKFLVTTSNPSSPLVHIRVAPEFQKYVDDHSEEARFAEEKLLRAVVKICRQAGILITVSNYILPEPHSMVPLPPPPSIRIAVTAAHTEEDLDRAAKTILNAAEKVLL